MNDDDGLDRLSSKQLYDLAVSYAKRHFDVRCFWDLMRLLPVAEAAAGELDETEAEVMRLSAHVDDLTDAGREPIADMLRPVYIEYLRRHGVIAASQTHPTTSREREQGASCSESRAHLYLPRASCAAQRLVVEFVLIRSALREGRHRAERVTGPEVASDGDRIT